MYNIDSFFYLFSQRKIRSVQFWVALFVEANKQIKHEALCTVKD